MQLQKAKEKYKEIRLKKTLMALEKKGFDAFYFKTREEATSKIMDMIPVEAVVGFGGSVTLRELGIPERLRERGNKTEDHWVARQKGSSPEKVLEVRRNQINSDFFLTSTNALTENGELVNIDGTGQRIAAMIFGPKNVIVVAGVNKIVRDLDEAMWRVRNVASPMNALRLNRNTPCSLSGVCSDCESPERICGATSIIHRRMNNTPLTVILVDEELGY